jgi:hypothetical protein
MLELSPTSGDRVHLPAKAAPLLFVIVDTEEEFDWNAPFSRANTSVRAIRRIGRLQDVLAARGVVPTYVVDFPIASQADGFRPLKDLADAGTARIGAHLHPWVTPPFEEEVNGPNSFGCALPPALERAKIQVLKTQIGDSFDRSPAVYKAGRYGFGPATAASLESLGFAIDVSVNPRMNYLSLGGPSFDAFDTTPFRFGDRRRLLEIPCTTDYAGAAGPLAPALHRFVSQPALQRLRLTGIMSKLHVVNKIMLSPEGSTLDEMKALSRSLFRRGVRTFSLTMHSPSVEPGCTPYVRNTTDLGEFLDRVAGYCDFFLGELGGTAGTPEDFLESLNGASAGTDSRQERCS